MPAYVPPIDDVRFLLTEMFDFDGVMGSLGATDTIDSDCVCRSPGRAGQHLRRPAPPAGDR